MMLANVNFETIGTANETDAEAAEEEGEEAAAAAEANAKLLKLKYKTRMCKSFVYSGMCRYGRLCKFAHSASEKNTDISTVYKFKSAMCRGWVM